MATKVKVRSADAIEFLTGHRMAVVGASDEKDNFGRTIYGELRSHGYEPVAVNPRAESVAGDPCYPSLADVPGDLDGVIVMVPADKSADVVRACIDRGIEKVWLFRGAGPGAVSEDAIELCRDNDIDVVPGACPLMFLEPVGGIHRIHRGMRRLGGSLDRSA